MSAVSHSLSSASGRRQYVDCLRGVAVIIMIMWHSIDSWHVRDGRTTPSFLAITFLAGWAAPLFLFLAGLSLALAGTARVARGVDRVGAARSLARRGWQVFLLAHLFRLQSFLVNPNASWNGLFKPDILNVLGLGLVAASFGWRRAVSWRARVGWLLVPAVVVAFVLAPLAPGWWWPTLLYPRFEAYIRPVGNQGVFSLFPAIGYVFAGTFVGVFLADQRSPEAEARFHRVASLSGGALVAIGAAVDAGLSGPAARWLQTPAVFSWRVGAMVVLLALTWLWLRSRAVADRHPFMVFGKTSMFVYWVHVELAYGAFSFPIWKKLTLPWAIGAYLLLMLVMYGAARLWLRRPGGPLIPAHMRAVSRDPLPG